jgi:hypothetical protein
VGFSVNASRGVLVAATSMDWGHELMLLTRAAPAPGPAQNFGLMVSAVPAGVGIEWAAQTNSVLQSSSDLLDWQTVANTTGAHAFEGAATNPAPTFYRVFQPQP